MNNIFDNISDWAFKHKLITFFIVMLCIGNIMTLLFTPDKTKAATQAVDKECMDQALEDRIKMAKDDAKANNHEGVILLLGRCHTKIAEGTEAHKLLTKANAIVEKKLATEKKRQLAEWKKEGVSIGMTKERVIQSSWGKPEKINSTTNAYGTREQWVYRGHSYLYFQDGILTTIQN